jgi:regulator of protease activity HflC (stomatin/prohibitin superfamily)
MSPSVFLSHASKDKKIVETLCRALESRGVACWLASRDVNPGENFMQAIVRAIRAAKIMVLVFTSNANDSDEIKRELVLASQYKLVIIPVRVEDVLPDDSLAYQFATSQWIDLFNDWEHQVERLTLRIIGLLAALDSPKSPGAKAEPRPIHSPSAAAAVEAPTHEPASSSVDTRTTSKSFLGLLAHSWRNLGDVKRFFLINAAFLLAFLPFALVSVPTGHVGVLWKRVSGLGIYCLCWVGRGTVLNPLDLRHEGLHFKLPWDIFFLYDLRVQSNAETYNAFSKDGVDLSATINIRTQLRHDSVPLLHQFVGPAYMAQIVSPEVGSRTREVIGQYEVGQVYSTHRREIEEKILQSAQERLPVALEGLFQREISEQAQMRAELASAYEDGRYAGQLGKAINIIDIRLLSIERPRPK